ncbi:Deoxyhypusine_synthase [Hexamita inflata]|uniref:Deoxyhypusine synthase n=1 Tax=Hexamita inflata TaxID=28002 RepID=A0AA86RGD2_9EUKA|nr:Deoxyhypusine synthase [Hexamita inflata]CAI9966605.1 Deoxyhypusine synthase [Hexamita inflata]
MTDPHNSVFKKQEEGPTGFESAPKIFGPDFNAKPSYDKIFDEYLNIGFQASSFGQAINEIKRMLSYRLSDDEYDPNRSFPQDPAERAKIGCKIFLGYTSNMVSSGLREVIRYLVQHKMVDVVVSSAGGIEEDFIKCMAPNYLGDFHLKGKELRQKSLNRTGNLIVPNDNYCLFEDWILPIFDECLELQHQGFHWTPSRLIWKLGQKINNEESIYYWAYKNQIPVFCPAITDGSLGDCLYFHTFQHPGLIIDVVGDIRAMNEQAVRSPKNGCVILGGGTSKHHIMNANLFTNMGADFVVYVNTAQEFDGCDSGARPDEAISWGKISWDAKPVKVYADATLVFPILVKKTFVEAYEANPEFYEKKCGQNPHSGYYQEQEEDIGVHVNWLD